MQTFVSYRVDDSVLSRWEKQTRAQVDEMNFYLLLTKSQGGEEKGKKSYSGAWVRRKDSNDFRD